MKHCKFQERKLTFERRDHRKPTKCPFKNGPSSSSNPVRQHAILNPRRHLYCIDFIVMTLEILSCTFMMAHKCSE